MSVFTRVSVKWGRVIIGVALIYPAMTYCMMLCDQLPDGLYIEYSRLPNSEQLIEGAFATAGVLVLTVCFVLLMIVHLELYPSSKPNLLRTMLLHTVCIVPIFFLLNTIWPIPSLIIFVLGLSGSMTLFAAGLMRVACDFDLEKD